MKKILFFILLCSFTATSFAQNKGEIHGFVQSADSVGLEKATVSIIDPQDSSIISYTLTDSKGKFSFVRMPQHKTLSLYISHVNANNFQKKITIHDTGEVNIGTIYLGGKILDEIIVTASPPVRMNQDTLEYNADYFKTRPNANVEELLKQLPGLQVNMDGTIYYEGKEVSQVKVNGKDFFTSDIRIATRNLDASLVKTVQVYRDKGESKRDVEDEENLPITLNLKFRSEFLRTDFGKAYASGGSRDRYESGGLFNTFRDTLQISFIAYGNNINRQSFDYNELNQHAGLGRSENYGFQDFGGRNYWGIGNDIAGGFNLNNDWGKKIKLNVMYMYRFNERESGNDGNNISLYDNIQQITEYANASNNRKHEHSLRTFLRHRFDTTAYYEFRPQITFNKQDNFTHYNSQTNTEQALLTDIVNQNQAQSSGINYTHRFHMEKQLSKAHIFSFSNDLSLNKTDSESSSDQQTAMYQTEISDTDIWQNTIQTNRTNHLSLSTAYQNKMVKNISIDIYGTFNTGKNSPISTFYYNRDGQGTIHGSNYENNYHFGYQDYISGVKFNWKPKKEIVINAGTAYQIKNTHFDFISIDNEKKSNESYWLANISMRYKDLNLGWSKDVLNPQIYGISTQINDLNPIYTQLPALDFGNIETQRTFISYNKYKQKIQFGSRFSLNYEDKSIGYRTWRDLTIGHTTSQNYQSGSKYNISGSFHFRYNFKIKKDWHFYISTQPYLYSYQNYQTINNIENKSTTLTTNLMTEFSINWQNRFAVAPKYTLSIINNKNSVKNNPDFTETDYVTHDFGLGFNVYPIKGFSLEMSYSLQNRANGLHSRQNYNIVNSSIYYTLKNNSQIKLSGFDILNQNVQNSWGTQGNSTFFSNSITLRQYFLLGYIHKFNITKMQDNK